MYTVGCNLVGDNPRLWIRYEDLSCEYTQFLRERICTGSVSGNIRYSVLFTTCQNAAHAAVPMRIGTAEPGIPLPRLTGAVTNSVLWDSVSLCE